eukprot:1126966-Heterocapsa_arctica.AAC.1
MPSLLRHRADVRRGQRENFPVSIGPVPFVEIWDGAPPYGTRARNATPREVPCPDPGLLLAGLRHALLPRTLIHRDWPWLNAAFAHGTALHRVAPW